VIDDEVAVGFGGQRVLQAQFHFACINRLVQDVIGALA
jgi:hypothetical protein